MIKVLIVDDEISSYASIIENNTLDSNSDDYTDKYHSYLRDIVDSYFYNSRFLQTIDDVDKLISPYVEKDATAFYTYDEYRKATEMFNTALLLRAERQLGYDFVVANYHSIDICFCPFV